MTSGDPQRLSPSGVATVAGHNIASEVNTDRVKSNEMSDDQFFLKVPESGGADQTATKIQCLSPFQQRRVLLSPGKSKSKGWRIKQ